jgi:hypothetical protein
MVVVIVIVLYESESLRLCPYTACFRRGVVVCLPVDLCITGALVRKPNRMWVSDLLLWV